MRHYEAFFFIRDLLCAGLTVDMAGDRVHQSVAKPPQLKEEQTSVIEIETTSGAQQAAAFLPPHRRLMRLTTLRVHSSEVRVSSWFPTQLVSTRFKIE